MACTESTLYSPRDATFTRSPSSTTGSDITLCAPGEQEYAEPEPKGRRRKTVAFSAAVITIYTGEQRNPRKPLNRKPLSRTTTSLDSGNFGEVQQQEAKFEGSSERCGPATRKRRLSAITHASQTSAETPNASTEAHSSTRKRRASDPRRVTNIAPLAATNGTASESKRGLGRLARDSLQLASAIRIQSREARPSSRNPPSDILDKIDDSVQTIFNRPSIESATFSLHRKYVLRTVTFSPSTSQCIVMLDASVHALLPVVYPSLTMDGDKCKFVIDRAEGMGDGVFAKTQIGSGEPILAERPVLVMPCQIATGFPLTHFYADMFSKLSPELLQVLKKPLTDQAPKKQQALNEGNVGCYDNIMQGYALAISLQAPPDELAELPQHRAIFPQMTKFNHSCGPNAHWKWNLSTFSLVLTAVRPIKAGEEITIAYVGPHLTSEERLSTLRSLYDFDCVCAFCQTSSPKALAQGDEARRKVLSFWDRSSPDSPAGGLPSFQDWCENHSLPHDILISAHLDAVNLIEREGLQILDTHSSSGRSPHPGRDLGIHFDILAMCYGALGDVDNFQKWIGRALESRGDQRPEERIAFRKWMSNPMSFPAWARRGQSGSGDPMSQYISSESTSKRHSKSVSVCGQAAFEGMAMFQHC